jgi:molybdopterin/thiamine biosynthesis adenylyltransferase
MRQMPLLDPNKFTKSVSVIGCGANGSWATVMLARQGIKKIRVWDMDKVESHNISNQAYGIPDIGMQKVDALKRLVYDSTGIEIEAHNEFVDTQDVSADYVFLMVDTMKCRGSIFENCLKNKFNISQVIETRMSIDTGRIYSFNPCNPAHVDEWSKTLYSDEVAEVSPCGAVDSIISTVMFISSIAVWRLIHHWDVAFGPNRTEKKGKGKLPNETLCSVGPEQFYFKEYKSI